MYSRASVVRDVMCWQWFERQRSDTSDQYSELGKLLQSTVSFRHYDDTTSDLAAKTCDAICSYETKPTAGRRQRYQCEYPGRRGFLLRCYPTELHLR